MIQLVLIVAVLAFVVVLERRSDDAWKGFTSTFPPSAAAAASDVATFDRAYVELTVPGRLLIGSTRSCVVQVDANGLALRDLGYRDAHFVPWSAIRACESYFVERARKGRTGVLFHLIHEGWQLGVTDPAGTAAWGQWRVWKAHAPVVRHDA